MRQALFKFEVKSLMFDVDGLKLKAIASNVIHQTSHIQKLVHFYESVFVSAAGRTYPICREISEFRASCDTVVCIAFSFVINVTANAAFVLIHVFFLLNQRINE